VFDEVYILFHFSIVLEHNGLSSNVNSFSPLGEKIINNMDMLWHGILW
jgi:hypothetical protein